MIEIGCGAERIIRVAIAAVADGCGLRLQTVRICRGLTQETDNGHPKVQRRDISGFAHFDDGEIVLEPEVDEVTASGFESRQ